MSYLEELRKARDKPQVAFTAFVNHTRAFPGHLFCFLEGADEGYYAPRIKRFTEEYHLIRCAGKEKVLAVHRLIANRAEYKGYRTAFFIDRDFQQPHPSTIPPIFETPCYSIENLYVSTGVFRELIKNYFHLQEVEPDFQACLDCYQSRQEEFHEAVSLFNAWYACLIEKRDQENIQAGAQLAEKFPRGWLSISLQLVGQRYDWQKIKNQFPNATSIPKEEVETKQNQFDLTSAHHDFRGKYELHFLLQILELLIEDGRGAQTVLKQKVSTSFPDRLTHAQAIQLFSAYAETPESLKEYLGERTTAAL